MHTLRGIPVSPGVAIGPALVLGGEGGHVPHRRIPAEQADAEWKRLRAALAAAAAEARGTQQDVAARLGSNYGAIFAAHALLFDDPSLRDRLDDFVRKQYLSAETAVNRAVRDYVRTLESLGANTLLAWRASDLFDIEKRVLKHLGSGAAADPLRNLREPVVVLAADLTPSETAALDRTMVFAFATEHGGRASHTAIMADAMEIPAVVGLGRLPRDIAGDDLVIVDGSQGLVVIDPDEPTLAKYRTARDVHRRKAGGWMHERDLPRRHVRRHPHRPVRQHRIPDRSRVVYRARPRRRRPVPHRIPVRRPDHRPDRGGAPRRLPERPPRGRAGPAGRHPHARPRGRQVPAASRPATSREKNPSLGLRSVRLCLREFDLFKTQMRAILRASAHGRRAHHVPDGQHAAGTPPVQDGSSPKSRRTCSTRGWRSTGGSRSAP